MTDHADTETGFPTKGSLKRIPFPQLIRQIARAEVTGSLYLLNGQTKKVVFFRSGKPISVRSNVISECLGQILASEGIITQEQSDNSLEAVRRTGKKQGELLIEMGLISEGNLRYGLDAQFRSKLGDIFSWEEGRFQFKPGGDDGGEVPPNECNEHLILAAIQSRYSDERARHALRPFAAKYPVATPQWSSDPTPLGLVTEEEHFLKCLDGSRSVDELLSGELDLQVPRVTTLTYGLIEAGVVDLKGRRLLARPKPKPPTLQPEDIDDAELTPDFEPASVIGEYEDTPLPNRLPTAAQSTSRMPALLTEDEEMFAGVAALDEDESVVLDTAHLKAKIGITDDETDFSDLDDDLAQREEPTTLDGSLLDLDEESFDDEVELLDDEEMVEVEPIEEIEPLAAESASDLDLGDIDALPDLDDLDELGDIDDLGDLGEPAPEPEPEPEPTPTPAPAPKPAAPKPAPAPIRADESAEAIPIDELSGLEEVATLDLDEVSEISPVELDELDELDEVSELEEIDDLPPVDEGLPPLEGLGKISAIAENIDDLPPLDEIDDIPDLGDIDDLDLGDIDLGGDVGDDDLDDLGDLDDLDDLDLGDIDDDLMVESAAQLAELPVQEELPPLEDVELDDLADFALDDDFDDAGDVGGARYQAAVEAMNEGDYATACAHFEDAYQNGYDVAELHAALAFSRYRAAGGNPAAAQDALELLDYAEQRDPDLDLVHAFRGAVLLGLGATDSARESFERALEINPYCDMAIQYINNM